MSDSYKKQQEYIAEWKKERASKVNDLWENFQEQLAHGPVNPERREACKDDLLLFCSTYFPEQFSLPFAKVHHEEVELLTDAIKNGAWFATAQPRGTGKTTRTRAALRWAIVYNHINYGVYIGATAKSAQRSNEAILKSFVYNKILREDFPEICLPFFATNGKAQKAVHQLYKGEPSGVVCGADRIATAYMPDLSYGQPGQCVIDFTSIGGEIRGRSFDMPNGKTLRPQLAIADDPQTREVAKSAQESQNVLDILKSDVAYMAGPTEKLGLLIPCTIIEKGDAADRMLDRELSPKFHGKTVSWFTSLPENEAIWEQYRELVVELQLLDTPEAVANKRLGDWYEENREECDKGAEVFWPEAYNPEEFRSAIHKGAHLMLEDRAAFFAEYQNNPIDEAGAGNLQLSVRDVLTRQNGLKEGVLPSDTKALVAFIDVQQSSLWYTVCAFGEDMSGAVVDYGTFPDQGKNYVTLRTIKMSMTDVFDEDYSAACLESLETLCRALVDKEWITETGNTVPLTKIGIDSGYSESRSAVYNVANRSDYRALVFPARGVGTSPRRPDLWLPGSKRKKGEQRGHQWRILPGDDCPRLLQVNTNAWKTVCAKAWNYDIGAPGSMSIFGTKGKVSSRHQAFAENMSSERSIEVEVAGTTLTMWELAKQHTDNHWFDCVVNCMVLANMEGCARPGMKQRQKRRRRKVKGGSGRKTLADRYKAKNG